LTSGFYRLALVFFALGLMSKAMLVTVPFLLVLLDVWPLGRVAGKDSERGQCLALFFEKWPFFALSAVFCVVTFAVQRHAAATMPLTAISLGTRLENATVSYLRYLAWTVWPAKLAAFYSFPYDHHFYLALWPGWEIGAAALLLVGVSALCLTQIVRRPYLAVGWFWYLGMMLPVIGLVQVGSQGMADRYTYLPLIGPVISLVWLVSEKWPARIFPRALLTTLATAILAACVLQTRHQLQYWKDTDVLSQHTADVTGLNPRVEYNLGLELERKGDFTRAMVHYRNAVTSQPIINEAFFGIGRLLEAEGRWAEAEKIYSLLARPAQDNFTCHLHLAIIQSHLGRGTEAVAHLEAALKACPDTPEAMNNLAWTLAASEDAELRDGVEAVRLAERACELTHYRETIIVGTLAAAYAEAGRFDNAIATAQRACTLASASGEPDLLKKNQELLVLYRAHRAYHETQ
jgi:tetratricopeptide (TPR) repeat protein